MDFLRGIAHLVGQILELMIAHNREADLVRYLTAGLEHLTTAHRRALSAITALHLEFLSGRKPAISILFLHNLKILFTIFPRSVQ